MTRMLSQVSQSNVLYVLCDGNFVCMSLVLVDALTDSNGKSALCCSECGCICGLGDKLQHIKSPRSVARASLSITGTFLPSFIHVVSNLYDFLLWKTKEELQQNVQAALFIH